MRARLKGPSAALAVAALMALPPAAGAQDPLPTISPTPSPTATVSPSPTPTTTPTPDEVQDAKTRKRKVVRRIYRDFEKDGRIAACDHTPKALKLTLDSISDEYNTDYPDFKDALKAAIRANKRQQCDVEETPTPSPTPSATAAPAPTSTAPTTPSTPLPTSTPFPTPGSTPESGSIPGLGGTFDNGSGNSKTPKGGKGASPTATPGPGEGAIPEGTPQPTPSPTPSAGPLPPKLVVTRASAEPNLFVPGTMLGISLLGLLFAALSALAARRSGRLAGVGHAWREAAFRASGAWAEFKDWLRLGR